MFLQHARTAALMADIPAQPLGEALAVFENQTQRLKVELSGGPRRVLTSPLPAQARRSRAPRLPETYGFQDRPG
jgi:hypothetical protein